MKYNFYDYEVVVCPKLMDQNAGSNTVGVCKYHILGKVPDIEWYIKYMCLEMYCIFKI